MFLVDMCQLMRNDRLVVLFRIRSVHHHVVDENQMPLMLGFYLLPVWHIYEINERDVSRHSIELIGNVEEPYVPFIFECLDHITR